jgi:hypothetical protein
LWFRKRPLAVQAMLYDGSEESQRAIVNWSGGKVGGWFGDPEEHLNNGYYLQVETLEGPMDCNIGDWIIKGIKGEFYACRGDIFEESYEEIARTIVHSDELVTEG